MEETANVDQSRRPRRPKSRQVSSRFLPLPSFTPSQPLIITKPDSQAHRSLDESGFIRKLRPSPLAVTCSKNKRDTLANHLNTERLLEKDTYSASKSTLLLTRQRSWRESGSSLQRKEMKEIYQPAVGGSMRYTGTSGFSSVCSSSDDDSISSHSSVMDNSSMILGSLSPDQADFGGTSTRRESGAYSFGDNLCFESECSSDDRLLGRRFPTSLTSVSSPAMSCRKSANEVLSKHTRDRSTRPCNWSPGPKISDAESSNISPHSGKFTMKSERRENSFRTYGSTMTHWAPAPGRSNLSPISGEHSVISSFKPPKGSTNSRTKSVGNLLASGLNLFRNKKSSSPSVSPVRSKGGGEAVHQLRLLHNGLIQWRCANATADAVNENLTDQAETTLLYAVESLQKLRHSVLEKKLQLEKEKLEKKLNSIVHSQIKQLEAWEDMERRHLTAVSMTKENLYSAVSRVPLVEGARVEPESASRALVEACTAAASAKSLLTTSTPLAEKAVQSLSELARVVAIEKSLLHECFQHLKMIFMLEIEEWSLRCALTQLNLGKLQE